MTFEQLKETYRGMGRVVFTKDYFEAKKKVLQEMTPDFQKTVRRDCTFAQHLASVLALNNQKQEALEWQEIAIETGIINYPLLAENDPFLENIRGEERFKKLMERVKYEWENFEV